MILDVQEDEAGELFIQFPEGVLPDDWMEGTPIEWVGQQDGSWLLRKKKMEFVEAVVEFNSIVGTGAEFDTRKTALYIGLQLEEMAEKIGALHLTPESKASLIMLQETLDRFSDSFKKGLYDANVEKIDRVEALDADIDLAVVALGGACAMGAKVAMAADEVMRSNLSKFPIDQRGHRYALTDANGKVKKAEGYSPPNLKGMV